MIKKVLLVGAFGLSMANLAHATTVSDPTGDFLASYTGPHEADLDVTSFSVTYDPTAQAFTVSSTMAGAIDASLPGFYAIGVNLGTGTSPFGAIGEGNVLFNKVIAVQKSGAATISGAPVPGGATINGASFSLVVPLSMLPSTGFTPQNYGWNIWPRSGAGGNAVISDFAPQNATIAAVPEPASWAMMLGGFGVVGSALRRRQRVRLRLA
jgi:hypothetical protein